MFEKKYDMTIEENVFYAKRNIVDYIYQSIKLEGLTLTFPETETIFEGILPTKRTMAMNDILVVINLKNAWRFLLDTLDVPIDYNYICQINRFVGNNDIVQNAGYLRQMDVKMGGTEWKPTIPNEEKVKEKIEELNAIQNPIERSLSHMTYLMRGQLFNDGNKRTAGLMANKVMIENGCGIVSIPNKIIEDYKTEVLYFYETGDSTNIFDFLYQNCIDGLRPIGK